MIQLPPNLGNGAFRLYCLLNQWLMEKKITVFLSQSYLANALNKSTRTIQRYLQEFI